MLNELKWPASILAVFLLGVLPALTIFQTRLVTNLGESEWPSRHKFYFSSEIGLWGLAFFSFVAAIESGFTPELMGLKEIDQSGFWIWLCFSLTAVAALVLAFKAFGQSETALLKYLIPQTRLEKIHFLGVSVTAGICEELVFRGFLVTALRVATGSTLVAVILSAAAFGVSHAHQHITGGIRAGLLGLVLTVPLLMTGSLFPAIVAHTIVDIAGGLWLAKWLIKS